MVTVYARCITFMTDCAGSKSEEVLEPYFQLANILLEHLIVSLQEYLGAYIWFTYIGYCIDYYKLLSSSHDMPAVSKD